MSPEAACLLPPWKRAWGWGWALRLNAGGGLLGLVEGSPPFFSHTEASVPSPPNAARLASTMPASACQLCRAACAACDPSAEGSTCQWLCAGWAAPGSPLEEKVHSIIKKHKPPCYFLLPWFFSLCSSKFPVGFNQIQARFMSLVNLGIFLGEKNPGYFFFFF